MWQCTWRRREGVRRRKRRKKIPGLKCSLFIFVTTIDTARKRERRVMPDAHMSMNSKYLLTFGSSCCNNFRFNIIIGVCQKISPKKWTQHTLNDGRWTKRAAYIFRLWWNGHDIRNWFIFIRTEVFICFITCLYIQSFKWFSLCVIQIGQWNNEMMRTVLLHNIFTFHNLWWLDALLFFFIFFLFQRNASKLCIFYRNFPSTNSSEFVQKINGKFVKLNDEHNVSLRNDLLSGHLCIVKMFCVYSNGIKYMIWRRCFLLWMKVVRFP